MCFLGQKEVGHAARLGPRKMRYNIGKPLFFQSPTVPFLRPTFLPLTKKIFNFLKCLLSYSSVFVVAFGIFVFFFVRMKMGYESRTFGPRSNRPRSKLTVVPKRPRFFGCARELGPRKTLKQRKGAVFLSKPNSPNLETPICRLNV